MAWLISNVLFSVVLGVWSLPAHAEQMLVVGSIQGESDEKSSVVSVHIQGDTSDLKPTIEDHGTFIQVIIAKAQVLEPGKFLDGNSPLIRKIAAFQINDQTAGLRLFVAEDAAKVRPAVSTDLLSNRLMIYVDHEKLASILEQDKPPFDGVPSASEIISRTEIRNNIPDPVPSASSRSLEAQLDKEALGLGVGSINGLEDKLEQLTIGLALVLFAGLIVWRMRRMLRKSGLSKVEQELFTMKTLASHALAPKQRLTLMEIGGQKILLGISPENISYLTSIPDQTTQRHGQDILNHISNRSHQQQAAFEPSKDPQRGNYNLPPEVRSSVKPQVASQKSQPYEASAKNMVASAYRRSAEASTAEDTRMPKSSHGEKKRGSSNDPSSIEDVTNLIRRKLKDLPKI